jgi:hypothetical protein
MDVLLALVWSLAGAIAGWGITAFRATMAAARAREQMIREIRAWQDETQRYKAVADRLAREKESWAAGIRQGRDDVISMMPLLIEAQQRLRDPGRSTGTPSLDDCA